MKKSLFLAIFLMFVLGIQAHLKIIQTTCNYQRGQMAVVEAGKIRVGWQYDDKDNWPISQNVYQIQVYENLTEEMIYDSGVIESEESQLIELPYLAPNQFGYYWRVRIGYQSKDNEQWNHWSDWSREQCIRVAPEDIKALPNNFHAGQNTSLTPQWIGAITKKDAHIPDGSWSNEVFKKDSVKTKWADVDTLSARSIILRKKFHTDRKVASAIVYVCGLGHYEMAINGNFKSEDVRLSFHENNGFNTSSKMFTPLWSDYNHTVYYDTYDVTDELRQGDNAINVLLGNGFFNVQRGSRYAKLIGSYGPPQLLLRMDIIYDDGTTEYIVSDDSWRWTPSPITFNSIYGGESYDARLEQDGLGKGEFDDSNWKKAVFTEGPAGKLRPECAQTVCIFDYYIPKSTKTIPTDSLEAASQATKRTVSKGAFVCDMGQNLAGFPGLRVKGKRGQKVTLIVSERLTPQGACDQSQTGRPHYYEYTLRGDKEEFWHPRFSYYGFRYIQVEGAVMKGAKNPDELPVISSLQSLFISNAAPNTSTFWCDNEILTKTHDLILKAEMSNMQGVLTDCPQREKLGWLEQDHLCGPSLLYNFDMTRLVPKIIRDIVDTQKPNGMVPTTAPQYVSFGNLFDDSPEWGSTLVILPFMYYDAYGDSTLIIDNYEPMRRYVDYLTSRAEDGIVSHGLGDWYDYGPKRPGFSQNTPVPLVATAHYIYDLQLITEAARMIGQHEDQQKYQELYNQVVSAFNAHFYHPDSCFYGTGSQASNALPLFLGITGDNKEAVLQSLIQDIHAHGDRLTTGDVGNRYLFRVLADNGQNELLFKMLNHYETPGYGFQIKQGATTLTEQWDPRQGSSENHFMLGQIDEWLFRTIVGVRQKPGTHGMRHLVIDPQAVGDIKEIRATYRTLYGPISVEFNKKDSTLSVTVPKGCEVEKPDYRPMKEQYSAHLIGYFECLDKSMDDFHHQNELSECYDPQLPLFWVGKSYLHDGIFGKSYDGFHLPSGFSDRVEIGFTVLQFSKNFYRGIAGYSSGLQMAVEFYEFDPYMLAKKVGGRMEFQPINDKLITNELMNASIRIPFLVGLQTYGRQLSIQTGPILHLDFSDYHYRYRGEKENDDAPFHTNTFRASWLATASIGPLTFSYTQSLVPLFRLTDGTRAYPSSFSVGLDLWYWDRRRHRPKF